MRRAHVIHSIVVLYRALYGIRALQAINHCLVRYTTDSETLYTLSTVLTNESRLRCTKEPIANPQSK